MAKPENACLDALPSRKIYAAFEQNNGGKQTCTEISTWTTEIETILNNKLKGPYDAKQCAEKVANVWCYVSELTSKGEACKTICDFFYYWLGCTLVDILKYSHEFREIMNQIYGVLVKFPNTGKCETINTAPTTSTTFFKPRKIIFDYLYDCSIVNSCSESTGHNCTSAYSTYTEEVEQKYRMVCANCVIETGGDPCCRKLKQRGGTSIPPNLSDLTCPEVSDSEPVQQLLACIEQQQQQQEQQQEQVQFVGPASGGSVVPAAVSSAVGLVGLPALAFFLYKYNLLPSWFSNQLNRRKKRTSATRRNFDDDTLTEDSSTITTIGSTTFDSTIASTLYNDERQPRSPPKRQSNNRPQQRTNISYHPT